ncbi:MAG: formate dehydrogenase accessory sulfurtransferase FdhD [Thermoleophilia bacterium]
MRPRPVRRAALQRADGTPARAARRRCGSAATSPSRRAAASAARRRSTSSRSRARRSAAARWCRELIEALPEALRAAQRSFSLTGGIHATGLFDARGELVDAREDVGRHNAMDKLIGAELLAGRLPAADRIALVSGRTSFELVQKAAVAGIPILCAVSAPSTLAVETARRLGMTLVGFLRGRRFNVYAYPERIDVSPR